MTIIQHASSLLQFIEQLQLHSTFSDLEIICEDGVFKSYRVLLGACSDLVRHCLLTDVESETACLILPGVKIKEVEAFHNSLYCYKGIPSHNQLDSVLKVLATIGVNMGLFIEVHSSKSEGQTFHMLHKAADQPTMVVPSCLNVIPINSSNVMIEKKMNTFLDSVDENRCIKPGVNQFELKNASIAESIDKTEYSCLYCEKKFNNAVMYEKHLERHRDIDISEDTSGVTDDKCDVEEETTTFTFDINEKDEIVSKTEPKYACEKCTTEFDHELDLEKHRKAGCTRQHFCESCNKMFSSSQTLSNHMKLHTKELEFRCDICGKYYVSRSVLGNHMKTHDSSYKIPRFNCNHCEKKFTHPSNLKRHIRTAHFELSDKKTYICQECGKSFRDPSARKHHLKTHLSVRPFPCNMCPKSFGSKSQYDNHIRIHTGEKPFLCNICGRCFVTKGQLKSHKINKHVGIQHNKSHLCQECGQSFVKEFDLRGKMFLSF